VTDYVVPIRCDGCSPADHDDLLAYLESIPARVLVADGSPPAIADHHRERFAAVADHVLVDGSGLNGKVAGVHAGIARATAERVVIADDDVRYTSATLADVVGALDGADLVVPQNVFPHDMPWHGRWDTARSLLNRAFWTDFPGTLAVRRSTFEAIGGYDGDVLFENLELIRTIEAAGGTVALRPDVYVERLAPTTARFLEQRVRQAYDDFARPSRLVTSLLVLPVAAIAIRRRRWAPLVGGVLGTMAVAEVGRRRRGGAGRLPASASVLAPGWVLERAVCSWLAVGARVVIGGCPYRGRVIRRAATPRRMLRRRLRGRSRAIRRTTAWSATGRSDTVGRPLAAR
jgi:hypothetical protein